MICPINIFLGCFSSDPFFASKKVWVSLEKIQLNNVYYTQIKSKERALLV
jgi:hypothetical protein